MLVGIGDIQRLRVLDGFGMALVCATRNRLPGRLFDNPSALDYNRHLSSLPLPLTFLLLAAAHVYVPFTICPTRAALMPCSSAIWA